MRNGVPWLRQPHFRSEGVQKTVDRYKPDLLGYLLQCFEALREQNGVCCINGRHGDRG
jgi:hypothetical protein